MRSVGHFKEYLSLTAFGHLGVEGNFPASLQYCKKKCTGCPRIPLTIPGNPTCIIIIDKNSTSK